MNSISRALIIFGSVLIILGIFLRLGAKVPWLGKLPGDICIKRENLFFYFPLTTSIIVSAILSLVLYLFSRR